MNEPTETLSDRDRLRNNIKKELSDLELQATCAQSYFREIQGLTNMERENLNNFMLKAKESVIKLQSYLRL